MITQFLSNMIRDERFSELLNRKYGFGAWLRQEVAFQDNLYEDTAEALGLWEKRIVERKSM